MPQPNCQYTTRYCWEADKVKTLIRLRAELSPLFTGKRNASKYAWAVVERELSVPLPLSKIIKKWNNLLQEYKAIKLSEEPKRREWPFFNLMDVYFSDQVNDPTLRLFSSTKTLGSDTLDDHIKLEDDPILSSAIAAATAGSLMDISDMMQETQSDKASENNFDDGPIDTQHCNNNNNNGNSNSNSININNNNNSNNNNNNLINNNNFNHSDRQREYEEKMENSRPTLPPQNYINPHHQTIDQYLLSWNNFHGNMCKGFHNLQKDEKMVDVTIAAGGKIFKAHKLVLSVCSPYFQKIFLDHPSTHPILFMADVNSSHMAGLLDFMYSGQVNVKYDDLPKFLKVAEAMQIKGLHTESTVADNDDIRPLKHTIKENKPINHNVSIPIIPKPHLAREPNFREHIKTKLATPIDHFNNNNNNSSNNNNISINNNNNSTPNNNNYYANANNNNNNNSSVNNNNNNIEDNNLSKYVIQQTNSSNKILDNQKYHKYFSKRKMMAQYEHEMKNFKRNKTESPKLVTTTINNHQSSMASSNESDCNSNTPGTISIGTNGGSVGVGAINETTSHHINETSQSIKVEPDILLGNDDDSNNEYYLADLSKKKHPQIERIPLKRQPDDSENNNRNAVSCS